MGVSNFVMDKAKARAFWRRRDKSLEEIKSFFRDCKDHTLMHEGKDYLIYRLELESGYYSSGKMKYPVFNIYTPEETFYNRESLEEAIQFAESEKCKLLRRDLESLLESKTDIQSVDIDMEIRGLVRDLNDMGYKTIGSCAGHAGERGYITFYKGILNDEDKERISEMCKDHGIYDAKFPNIVDADFSAITFRGIG